MSAASCMVAPSFTSRATKRPASALKYSSKHANVGLSSNSQPASAAFVVSVSSSRARAAGLDATAPPTGSEPDMFLLRLRCQPGVQTYFDDRGPVYVDRSELAAARERDRGLHPLLVAQLTAPLPAVL